MTGTHTGDCCRLLLSEDGHELQQLCQRDALLGYVIDLLCGAVGSGNDAQGKPSYTAQRKAEWEASRGEHPYVELSGAHLAMPSSCISRGPVTPDGLGW